jgi:uncharacterized protein YndB with AHSA1/START domain
MQVAVQLEPVMSRDFATTITVDHTPEEVFDAITNVRGWWSGQIDGSTDKLNDEFTYRYEDVHYSRQRITELIPGKKVVWRVLDSSLSFVEDKNEVERYGDHLRDRSEGGQGRALLHPCRLGS